MTHLNADDLKTLIGAQAAGPDGFGISHVATAGADINHDTTAIETEVDAQSVERAHALNNAGTNEKFTAMMDPVEQAGSFSAVPKALAKSDHASTIYVSMLEKSGTHKNVDRIAQRAQNAFRNSLRRDLRTLKDPMYKRQLSEFERVRQAIKQTPQKNNVAFNPDQLPESIKTRLVQEAIAKGQTVTSLGPVNTAVDKMALGLTHQLKKWGPYMAAGSFIDLTPRLKPHGH